MMVLPTFFKAWIKNPRRVGALAPTGHEMAEFMATVVHPESDLPVLELGPGTGVITEAILARGIKPENLVSLELSQTFMPDLRKNFPDVRFIRGDAFDIVEISADLGIKKYQAVISALPLLTTKICRRVKLVEDLLDLMPPQHPLIQFTYMFEPPIPRRENLYQVHHAKTIYRNFPPARIWVYQKSQQQNCLQKSKLLNAAE